MGGQRRLKKGKQTHRYWRLPTIPSSHRRPSHHIPSLGLEDIQTLPNSKVTMASSTFRDSMNSLGWSRRDPDLPVNTSSSSASPFLSRLQSLNPFGDGGYVRLPTTQEAPGAPLPAPTRREEEEGFFACESETNSLSLLYLHINLGDGSTSSCVPVLVTRIASCTSSPPPSFESFLRPNAPLLLRDECQLTDY